MPGRSVSVGLARSAGVAVVAGLLLSSGATGGAAQGGVDYRPPSDALHRPLHDRLKAERWLERMQVVIGTFRLPRPVTLRLESCGEVDAWFEKRTVAVCYEYLQVVIRRIESGQLPPWVTADEALAGAFVDAILHETAHALFEQQRIPVLGREEEAADQVSAFTILTLGGEDAPGLIRGMAQLYLSWIGYYQSRPQRPLATGAAPGEARAHPTSGQRLYNLVCLALGFDRKAFTPLAKAVDMPEDRASDCAGEHEQMARAHRALIRPHVDPAREAEARRALRSFAARR